jgi:hypothetical protein
LKKILPATENGLWMDWAQRKQENPINTELFAILLGSMGMAILPAFVDELSLVEGPRARDNARSIEI